MNSTWIKIAIAYTAGMITYSVWQNYEETGELKKLESLSNDILQGSTALNEPCACVDTPRYNVTPIEESGNIACDSKECKLMVNGATPTSGSGGRDGVTAEPKGAWFSKETLDLMFCEAKDANGIFVYKGTKDDGTTKEPVYVIEAARTNMIKTDPVNPSIVYYSRTLCPNICGICGE